MYNSEHKTMSPRISFSNDFVESHSQLNAINSRSSPSSHNAPISTDFEFSVSNSPYLELTAADELFFKGRILPLNFHRPTTSTTLRDELLAADADHSNARFSLKPPFKGGWMKGLLGLRKTHIASTKTASNAHKQQGMMRDGGATSAAETEM